MAKDRDMHRPKSGVAKWTDGCDNIPRNRHTVGELQNEGQNDRYPRGESERLGKKEAERDKTPECDKAVDDDQVPLRDQSSPMLLLQVVVHWNGSARGRKAGL